MNEWNGESRVAFGSGKDDTVPLLWASRMLTELRDTKPALFGKLLASAATAQREPAGR